MSRSAKKQFPKNSNTTSKYACGELLKGSRAKGAKIMGNSFKTERSGLATKAAKIAMLVIFAVFAGGEAQSFFFNDGGGTGGVIGIPVRTAPPGPTSPVPANAQGGKGAWVFVRAGLDEANSYYSKNELCFDTKIGMPSSHSMVHYFEGTGRCDWARKNEYSKFGFQWTDPGSPLIPESVLQITLTATIEFDQLRPDMDRGAGAITVSVSYHDKARMYAVGDGQLQIGPGKKGDSHLPTSANKTIEWKVPRGWTKDDRLQISMQGSSPQTKQTYNYWYEWREGSSGAEPPPPSSHPHVVRGPDGKLRPAPGYEWVSDDPDDLDVNWSPGMSHPQHSNVVAGTKEGSWKPAPGYRWVNDDDLDDLQVVSKGVSGGSGGPSSGSFDITQTLVNPRFGDRTVSISGELSSGYVIKGGGSSNSGTFPAAPFNELQVTSYSITGVQLDAPEDSAGFAVTRHYRGRLTGGPVTITGTTSELYGNCNTDFGSFKVRLDVKITVNGITREYHSPEPCDRPAGTPKYVVKQGPGTFSLTVQGGANVYEESVGQNPLRGQTKDRVLTYAQNNPFLRWETARKQLSANYTLSKTEEFCFENVLFMAVGEKRTITIGHKLSEVDPGTDELKSVSGKIVSLGDMSCYYEPASVITAFTANQEGVNIEAVAKGIGKVILGRGVDIEMPNGNRQHFWGATVYVIEVREKEGPPTVPKDIPRVDLCGRAVQQGNKTPVAGARISLVIASGSNKGKSYTVENNTTNNEGKFCITGRNLATGEYEILVQLLGTKGIANENDLWPVKKYILKLTYDLAKEGSIDAGIIEMERVQNLDFTNRPEQIVAPMVGATVPNSPRKK